MKKYILIVLNSGEMPASLTSILQQLKTEFRCMFANGCQEGMGLLKLIKPGIILIPFNEGLSREAAQGIRFMQTLPVVKSTPMILYSEMGSEIILKTAMGEVKRASIVSDLRAVANYFADIINCRQVKSKQAN